jgi:hypothetical protein
MTTTTPTTPAGEPEKERVGQLNKAVLRGYVRYGCERKLFVDMGFGDPRWLKHVRALEKTPFLWQSSEGLLKKGREFEQRVYAMLTGRELLDVVAGTDPSGKVTTRDVRPGDWEALAARFAGLGKDTSVMLEHQFAMPKGLVRRWLGLGPGEEVPIAQPPQYLRPDLTLFVDERGQERRRALRADGTLARVAPEDARAAVRFVDVKFTNRENVGKKHFIELLVYAHAFAVYLHGHGLEDRMYVALDGHGIMPQLDTGSARCSTLADLEELCELMPWDDHAHLLESVTARVADLWERAPAEIADVDANLQPACVLCPYVGECRKLAGYDAKAAAQPGASVELLPYTSGSIAEQLTGHGIDTIAALDARGDSVPEPTTPTPLAAERPMLALKARALATGAEAWASAAELGDQRHLSMAIPRDLQSVLTFCAEKDPTHDRIFAAGFSLDVTCKDIELKSGRVVIRPQAAAHDAVWGWVDAQSTRRVPTEAVTRRAVARMFTDDHLDAMLCGDQDLDARGLRERRVALLRRMVELRNTLVRWNEPIEVLGGDEEGSGGHLRVRWRGGLVNMDVDDLSERNLARQIVERAVAACELVAAYEELAQGWVRRWDERKKRDVEYTVGSSSAILFWSSDQLEHVRDMLERHLVYLLTDPGVCDAFQQLIELVTPSDSDIQRDYRNRKVFDLRQFVETSVGLPQIINYTWHETARAMLIHAPEVDPRYWSEHYNYMYFGQWHEFVDTNAFERAEAIRDEARRKATTLNALARLLLGRARFNKVVSSNSRAMKASTIAARRARVPAHYHFLARAWLLYTKLDASLQAETAAAQRLTFPLRSIGKLVAAHLTHLAVREDEDGRAQLSFTLGGLSASSRFKPGSFAYLVHETRRDQEPHPYGNDTVVLDEMTWDSATSSYRVTAHSRGTSPNVLSEGAGLDPGGWYLYETAGDYWSGKLTRTLGHRGLDASWLAQRLAFVMNLLPANTGLPAPESLTYDLAQAYMYAPRLLDADDAAPEAVTLRTRPQFPPDPSQLDAIRRCLANPTSCILGPPGTGKSQTIATLLDELVASRPDGPLRVLVSASSYAPMRVVLEKLRAHQDANGHPSRIATLPKVWVRSQSRDPLDYDDVTDVVLGGNTLFVDGEQIRMNTKSRLYPRRRKRMEDVLPDRFVMFGVPHQLANFFKTRKNGSGQFTHIDTFCFDMILVDEASQMPVDQALTLAALTRQGSVEIARPAADVAPGEPILELGAVAGLERVALVDADEAPMDPGDLTRLVFVGDHNQLPPVQQVEPPERLRPVLESAFAYFQVHQGVTSTQLATNYRSRPEVVAYTNDLGLYERRIDPFHVGANALPPLPDPPAGLPGWVADVLRDDRPINAIIHPGKFDTAVSEVEAAVVREVILGFLAQVDPQTPDEERAFWTRGVGVVSPHNAHGRLVIRTVYAALTSDGPRRSALPDDELMRLLNETVYSVEKFQGSDRDLIIATMGISAVDQLEAEETFIYDLNRLNVLTSRAIQKMLLVSSASLLDHVPRTRRMIGPAARLRAFAHDYCNTERGFTHAGERLTLRWHDPEAAAAALTTLPLVTSVPSDASPSPAPSTPQLTPEQLLAQLQALDLGALDPVMRAAMEAQIKKLGGSE